MDQKGCRYMPHVIALMRGGSVEFRNSDATMHNIHTMPSGDGNQRSIFAGSEGRAAGQCSSTEPEIMMPVRCNNHPWMNAFINVADTPFFAVTDADGHFEIKGLPAGTYALGAVHEKMGEQTMTVTVKPQENSQGRLQLQRQVKIEEWRRLMSAAISSLGRSGAAFGAVHLNSDFVSIAAACGFWCSRCFCRGSRCWWRGFRACLAPFICMGLIPPLFWVFLPRVLVLYLIYVDQGFSLWFVIHLVVASDGLGRSADHQMRRRRRDEY